MTGREKAELVERSLICGHMGGVWAKRGDHSHTACGLASRPELYTHVVEDGGWAGVVCVPCVRAALKGTFPRDVHLIRTAKRLGVIG